MTSLPSSIEDLSKILDLLTNKINDLEKKVNVLELNFINNGLNNTNLNNNLNNNLNISTQVIANQDIFRNIPYIIRQNGFMK